VCTVVYTVVCTVVYTLVCTVVCTVLCTVLCTVVYMKNMCFRLLYVVNRATSKKETDSIVVYNLSSDSPQIADTLYNSAVSRIKGLGVRATGSRAIFLSSTSLYAAKFNHEGDVIAHII